MCHVVVSHETTVFNASILLVSNLTQISLLQIIVCPLPRSPQVFDSVGDGARSSYVTTSRYHFVHTLSNVQNNILCEN
jgi:hypothetical protein